MKRRDFLYNSIPAVLAPTIVNGFAVKSATPSPMLEALMNMATETDHVLVIIQLNGGNDGLNMVIPRDNYSAYFNARSNVAIAENKILALSGNVTTGLHPSMTGLQSLYNEGKLALVQAVGYPNPNFSHFRATDIWMTASDSNQSLNTGWAGRYLNEEYPNFPTGYPNSTMPDPLAIQIGSITSMALQGPAFSMGMSITNPTSFYNLVNGIQDPAPATLAGKELTYIRTVAQQTQQYSTVIKNAANNITTQNPYPANNSLGDQLKIVARLIKGGLKTRVYMVSLGGFDTHSVQAITTDTSTGVHANLLRTVSDGIKAFMDDCKSLGIEQRVMGLTFSEFGRRIMSNSSVGTDHGAAAPMFVFGGKVKSGVLGQNPVIPAGVTVNDNIPMQFDFRSIYASVLQDWFCASSTTLQSVLLKNFQSLPLVQSGACATGIDDLNRAAGETLILNYPNPFEEITTISFKTNGGHTLVQVIDSLGRVVTNLIDRDYSAGKYTVTFNSRGLPSGIYYMRLQNGPVQQVKSMLKVRS
jgi:uncharacterized protein (DUF1501 family)